MKDTIIVAIIGAVTTIIAAIIAGMFAIRKTDKSTAIRATEPEDRKPLARRVISQTTAMLFVDLMRLLYIASNDRVRNAHAGWHVEFVNFATQHLEELKSHFTRLSVSLGTELEAQSCDLERQLSYMLNKLKVEQDLSGECDEYFMRMHKIGRELHDFCMTALGESYERTFDRVREKVNRQLTENRSAITRLGLDQIWSLRLNTQTDLLETSRDLGETELYTISDDMTHQMAIPYFILDYKILRDLAAA
jgi:hypothetical protein